MPADTGLPMPGEHHFVSAYLVPKIFKIAGRVPDYINPDGTKNIFGDVVYFKDGKHHYGIEVKLKTVRLTQRENNRWILGEDRNLWPNLFIGIGSHGISVASWEVFRTAYIQAVRKKSENWSPQEVLQGRYGRMKEVNELHPHFGPTEFFRWSNEPDCAARDEQRFTVALAGYLSGLTEKPITLNEAP